MSYITAYITCPSSPCNLRCQSTRQSHGMYTAQMTHCFFATTVAQIRPSGYEGKVRLMVSKSESTPEFILRSLHLGEPSISGAGSGSYSI